jgi:adenylate cyclase
VRRFWSELKRRGVIRVVVAYVIVGVGVGGAAEVFLPNLGAPEWALSTVLAMIVLGLPIAAVMSWAFDVTPDHGPFVVAASTGRAATGTAAAPTLTSGPSTAGAGAPDTPPSLKSIVVLPFTNLSADPGNEYFSDGVTEDILTYLARIQDLHVISRTSAMAFKGSSATIREIAAELGVATVLEGSVRRADDRVRVTAQLIDAATDRHIWAEQYDRALDDIFAVQSDVAEEIANALQARLSPQELSGLRDVPAPDMETYELYVKGRQAIWTIQPQEISRGVSLLEAATERDPKLAGARATLAFGYLIAAYWAGAEPRKAWARAFTAARQALELDPRNPTAWGALGAAQGHQDFDWDGSAESMKKATEFGPNDRDAYFFRGVNLLTKGCYAEAAVFYQRAAELDPLDPLMASHRAVALWCGGDAVAGEKIFGRVLTEYPNFADAHGLRALGLSRDGRWEEFAEANHRGAKLTGMHPVYRAREALGLRKAGRIDEALEIVAEVREADLSTLSNVRAVAALAAGEDELALEELSVAIEERQPMPMWMRIGKFFDESDPRVRECFALLWHGRWGEG